MRFSAEMTRIPERRPSAAVCGVAPEVVAILAVGFFSLTSMACGRADVHARSVLLVTFDTTRADRLGAYGFGSAHTPTVDRLASGGVVFEHALAPTPTPLRFRHTPRS
jgi:hypothetical protein